MKRVVREADLPGLARELATALPERAVLWLRGGLGAGKTTLARALAEVLGAGEGATSPTFSLVHRYETRAGPVFHLDCYRLRSPDEASAIDWGEMEAGRLLMIEWPERGGAWVPPPAMVVSIHPGPDSGSRVVEMARGGAA